MTVEVKEQVSLPLSKCMELVLSGIKYRIFRAAITVTVIALAVAFLMYMLSDNRISAQVAAAIGNETAPRKLFDRWTSRMSKPLNEKDLTKDLVALKGKDDPRWQEMRDWGKLDDASIEKLASIAQQQQAYTQDFFDKLPEGKRRQLIGNQSGPGIYEYLSIQGNLKTFWEKLQDSDRKLAREPFEAFLKQWQETDGQRQQIIRGHQATLAPLEKAMEGKSSREAIADGKTAFRDALARQHYRISPEEFEQIQNRARFSVDADRIRQSLNTPGVKQKLAERLNLGAFINEADLEKLFAEVSSDKGARWLVELAGDLMRGNMTADGGAPPTDAKPIVDIPADDKPVVKLKAPDFANWQKKTLPPLTIATPWLTSEMVTLTQREELVKNLLAAYNYDLRHTTNDAKNRPERARMEKNIALARKELDSIQAPLGDLREERAQRMTQVASDYQRGKELAEVEATIAGASFSGRTLWLIVVSFLVCVVGIANAMLMSVTERFREIATMKCLGATDGFIMINFILESIMQGIAGGIVGAILGLILGTALASVSYGSMAWLNFPLGGIAAMAGVSLVVGVVVSALAAVYPAYVAARLAPMEAMRIE